MMILTALLRGRMATMILMTLKTGNIIEGDCETAETESAVNELGRKFGSISGTKTR
jgi:hypothetical protein